MNYARFQGRLPWPTFAPDDETGGGPATEPAAAGDDTVEGEAGDDTVEGAEGDDSVEGEAGEDTLEGAGGEDSVAGGAADDAAEEEPPRTRVPWQQKRIDRLTAQARDAEAAAEALRLENEALRALAGRPAAEDGGEDTATDPPAGPARVFKTEAEFQAAVAAEAARTSTVSQLNQQVDKVYDAAIALDPKFEARIPELREAVGEQLAKRPSFFKALVKLENGAAVINELSKDLDAFTELVELDDVDLALALKERDSKVKKVASPRPPSRAGTTAKPVRPVEGSSTEEPTLETAKTAEEHAAIRAKQRAARQEARGGWHN